LETQSYYPTARQHSHTCGNFDEGNIGINGHRNHYSPDLTPNDFQLFRPMKMVLGEQEFETDDELKFSAIKRLCSWDKTTHAAGINNLLGE
jgi:hypothetical protein